MKNTLLSLAHGSYPTTTACSKIVSQLHGGVLYHKYVFSQPQCGFLALLRKKKSFMDQSTLQVGLWRTSSELDMQLIQFVA